MEEETVEVAVIAGEKLYFVDDTFTQNITNLGILFYSDGPNGMDEIYYTLQMGGISVVTLIGRLRLFGLNHTPGAEIRLAR